MEDLTAEQHTIDDVVVSWPEVRPKATFGHRGYVHNGKMFGFLADEGAAVKVFAGAEADELYARPGVHAFSHSGMEMRAWAVLPLRDEDEIAEALTAMQAAYERAVAT
ncbi:MAG: TfoX/Sxy family protein [Actinobacteria bacterium]|nr:MAG: TfoX/Sxy family protein [Actinomycetota bacterium]